VVVRLVDDTRLSDKERRKLCKLIAKTRESGGTSDDSDRARLRHVANARALRSSPRLDRPAIDAVRQRMFAPTLMNGVPVELLMIVTENFTLS
jgi:hypothetical protein